MMKTIAASIISLTNAEGGAHSKITDDGIMMLQRTQAAVEKVAQ